MIHVETASSWTMRFRFQKQFSEEDIKRWRRIALFFGSHCRYHEAEKHYERTLREARILYSKTDPRLLEIELHLAGLYTMLERLNEAEELYRQCATELEQSGSSSLALFDCYLGLAHVLKRKDFDGEQQLLSYAEQKFESFVSKDDAKLFSITKALATTESETGNFSEAEASCRGILAHHVRDHGEKDHRVLLVRHELASTYFLQGRFAEARLEFESLIALWEQDTGGDHPLVLKFKQALAWTYLKQGELLRAKDLFNSVVDGFDKVLGKANRKSALSLLSMGGVLIHLHEFAEAREALVRSLDAFRAQPPGLWGDKIAVIIKLAAFINQQIGKERYPPVLAAALSEYPASLKTRSPTAFDPRQHDDVERGRAMYRIRSIHPRSKSI